MTFDKNSVRVKAIGWLAILLAAAPKSVFVLRGRAVSYGGFFLRFLSALTSFTIILIIVTTSFNKSFSVEKSIVCPPYGGAASKPPFCLVIKVA